MNCNQAKSELIAYIQGELSPEKKKRLEDHLARCPSCRRELEQAKRILDWTEAASSATIIRKVYEYMKRVVYDPQASDLHFEPQQDDTLRVRMRADGVLHEIDRLDAAERHGVTVRLKIMADMSVAETGVPQRGRIPVRWEDKDYVFYASSIPFVYGEGIHMVLQSKSLNLPDLRQELYTDQYETLMRVVGQPTGLTVVGGPTGSGKTTAAYYLMSELNSPDKNMIAIDDYCEYSVPGLNQIQSNPRAGFSVPDALRAMLRHDPDVILVNELAEYEEIAQLCTHLGLTGHMVIGVIMANSAVEAIRRLRDLGVDSYLLANSLVGITNQRLARNVCGECKEAVEIEPDSHVTGFLGITPEEIAGHTIYRGRGCGSCHNTGYCGRTLIMEVLEIDNELSKLIGKWASEEEILEAAKAKGFVPMREIAKRRVLDGITTPEEAFRVLVASDIA